MNIEQKNTSYQFWKEFNEQFLKIGEFQSLLSNWDPIKATEFIELNQKLFDRIFNKVDSKWGDKTFQKEIDIARENGCKFILFYEGNCFFYDKKVRPNTHLVIKFNFFMESGMKYTKYDIVKFKIDST